MKVCAIGTRNHALRDAMLEDARGVVDATVIDDAQAAASLMAMNNVEDQVIDAIRIAAVMNAAAVSLELGS